MAYVLIFCLIVAIISFSIFVIMDIFGGKYHFQRVKPGACRLFLLVMFVFRMIAKVEAEHEKRYRKLLSNIETGTVFEKAEAILWQCRNCGFVIESKKAPQKCPACEHPQAYFEPMKQNY